MQFRFAGGQVITSAFDLFKKDTLGNPVWIDAVADLVTARCRLKELASVYPGEYFVFDQHTSRVVARLDRCASKLGAWEVC